MTITGTKRKAIDELVVGARRGRKESVAELCEKLAHMLGPDFNMEALVMRVYPDKSPPITRFDLLADAYNTRRAVTR